MPVFQGFPPWPASVPGEWPDYCGGAPGTLFLGPAAPVPMNSGGPLNSIIPAWSAFTQLGEWLSGEPVPEPEPEPEPSEPGDTAS